MTKEINDRDKRLISSSLSALPKTTADTYFKRCMTDVRLARDFLHFNLPESIRSQVDLTTLALAPQEYVTAALRQKTADVVYTVGLKDSNADLGYVGIVVEHQSRPRRDMPLRMFELMVTMTRQIWDNRSGQPGLKSLPVVIPLIVSNYGRQYPYSVRYLDLFSPPSQAIMAGLLNEPLPMVDLSSLPDAVLETHLRSALMELALKHARTGELNNFFEKFATLLGSLVVQVPLEDAEARIQVENLLCYLLDNIKEIPSTEEVDKLMAKTEACLPEVARGAVMTLREHFEQRILRGIEQGREQGIEQGIERGIEQGIERGIEQGREQGIAQVREQVNENAKKTALIMLKDGIAKEAVCRYVNLSMTELEALVASQPTREINDSC